MAENTKDNKDELLAQIAMLREERKELRAAMNEHKKIGSAIYQKSQKAVETIE